MTQKTWTDDQARMTTYIVVGLILICLLIGVLSVGLWYDTKQVRSEALATQRASFLFASVFVQQPSCLELIERTRLTNETYRKETDIVYDEFKSYMANVSQ